MQLLLSQTLLLSFKTPTTFDVELKQGQEWQALYMVQPCTHSTTCYSCVTGPFLLCACHGELAVGQQQYNMLHSVTVKLVDLAGMPKTGCSGETRLVLHAPGSS